MEEYANVSQCIELLKETHLPTIKKLRVETQLIQIKRLLLADEATDSKRGSNCRPLFDGLMGQMAKICGGKYNGQTLTEQVERLSWLLSAVGKHEATQCQPIPV